MLRLARKVPRNGIVPDIFACLPKRVGIGDTHLREAFLPDRGAESKLPSGPEREATLDELQRSLDADVAFDREQGMEVVGHDDEFVESELSLGAIVVQHADE